MPKKELEYNIIDQCLIGRRICRWKRNYDKFILSCGFESKQDLDGDGNLWAIDAYGNKCPFQKKTYVVTEEVI